MTGVTTGLGWPERDVVVSGPLGWPTGGVPDSAVVSRETPGPTTALPEGGGLSNELPQAADIRQQLATAAEQPAATSAVVSRETSDRAERWPRPDSVRILGVANQKGGVGKTTSAVNLAAALSVHGARVLVIDLDPQGNASTAFGVAHHPGVPSVYDVLVDGRSLDEVAAPVADLPSVWCAPATIDLAGAEIELVSVVARETRLQRAIAAQAERYDYVFIDCPPSLGLLTVNAMVAAREVLIPIQCEFYALEGLSQLLRNIELIRSHLNPHLHVSTILLTMYDGRTRLAEQVAEEVRGHFGDIVLSPTIPRSVRVSEAPGYGQTVLTYDRASRGAQAYIAAARELAHRSTQVGPPTPVPTTGAAR